MTKQELVIEASDVRCFQVFCGNPNCWSTVTYLVEALPTGFMKKCPSCGKDYPESLIEAVESYVLFLKKAAKATPARITLRIEI